ncbi:NAD(P)-binding protein [Lipomyces orientalis]|uniref:NAD(P)-binding protein n=1 Tax=Lipomyces orientalis TaxID=1233043 RepID=A0ACC3TCE3_9ASCO
MSKKIISIVGATGTQGGSVVDALLNSDTYTIRAVTRNPASEAAQRLAAKGVEVVQADADNISSLATAFTGSHAIYAVSDFVEPFAKGGPEHAMEVESRRGINLAKAASAISTLEHYIWSTLPNSKKISGGRIVVPHFESKNQVDEFIQSEAKLLAKTTFVVLGLYAENFVFFPLFSPIRVPGTDQYIQLHSTASNTSLLALGAARTNVGLFVSAILAQPEKTLPGQWVYAYTDKITLDEMLQAWSVAQGNTAHYVQVEKELYYALWPSWGEENSIMMDFFAWAGDKYWSGEGILTKDDLDVKGLVDVKKAYVYPSL